PGEDDDADVVALRGGARVGGPRGQLGDDLFVEGVADVGVIERQVLDGAVAADGEVRVGHTRGLHNILRSTCGTPRTWRPGSARCSSSTGRARASAASPRVRESHRPTGARWSSTASLPVRTCRGWAPRWPLPLRGTTPCVRARVDRA